MRFDRAVFVAAGSYVHMMDPWWNPAVEDQAMVRNWLAFCSKPGNKQATHLTAFLLGLLCCLCPLSQLLAA
jgi:hypothetical protein